MVAPMMAINIGHAILLHIYRVAYRLIPLHMIAVLSIIKTIDDTIDSIFYATRTIPSKLGVVPKEMRRE